MEKMLQKKIVAASMLLLLAGAMFGILPASAKAVDYRDRDYVRDYDRNDVLGSYSRLHRMRDRMVLHSNRLDSRVYLDRDFLDRSVLGSRYNRFIDREVLARDVVLVNRDSDETIVLSNRLTGPFSRNVNRVVLGVDRDFFDRVRSNINIDEDIRIRVNTGNNRVSFNTVVGDIETGDVDISIR